MYIPCTIWNEHHIPVSNRIVFLFSLQDTANFTWYVFRMIDCRVISRAIACHQRSQTGCAVPAGPATVEIDQGFVFLLAFVVIKMERLVWKTCCDLIRQIAECATWFNISIATILVRHRHRGTGYFYFLPLS